jgi:uncharacterized protein (DUF302 family)
MSTDNQGLVSMKSTHSYSETVSRIRNLLQSRGLTVFASIDFSGDAGKAGLKMRPTSLVVFGNPASGTPVIVSAPSSAIDLPLKVLVSEDQNGDTWLTYNSPAYLAARHGIPQELLKNISGVEGLVRAAAN